MQKPIVKTDYLLVFVNYFLFNHDWFSSYAGFGRKQLYNYHNGQEKKTVQLPHVFVVTSAITCMTVRTCELDFVKFNCNLLSRIKILPSIGCSVDP